MEDGSLYTFGNNWFGQLGKDPNIVDCSLPTKVDLPDKDGAEQKIATVDAGPQGTVAATTTGTPFCFGEEGIGRDEDSPTKEPEIFDLVETLRGYRVHRVLDIGLGLDHGALILELEKAREANESIHEGSVLKGPPHGSGGGGGASKSGETGH